MFEYDKYYRECQQQNKPFIKAKTSPLHKNYLIQIDLMTCNYVLSEEKQEQIRQLAASEVEYVKSKCNYDFNGFSITSELSWFDGVSSEHADGFCNDVYDVIQERL